MINKIKINSTFSNLLLLIVIFLVGFISLFSLNQAFDKVINNLDKETENLNSQITIGEFIALDIVKTRSLFNELVTTTNSKRSRALIVKEIQKNLHLIQNSLDVLEKGGSLKREIVLNIAGHINMVKTITYHKDENKEFSMEVIDIYPKINDIKRMITEVESLLEKRTKYHKIGAMEAYWSSEKQIRRYYKSLPAFFNRMTENIRRLLYESSIELSNLEEKIEIDKNRYLQLKVALIIIVISLVLILWYIIVKNINETNEKLSKLNDELINNLNEMNTQEKSIRAILDTQSSIVALSDGENIQNANKSLFDFLDDFNNLEEFKKKHSCVCELFDDNIPSSEYIQYKMYGDKKWFEHILAHPEINFKAIIIQNNKTHHFSINLSKTIFDEELDKSFVVISLHDITEEIENQIKLKELNENLEQMVDEKTKELMELNESLEQKITIESKKVREQEKLMLEQVKLASMGEMLGNIAHQWRQPLSVITSSISGLQVKANLDLEVSNEELSQTAKLIVKQAKYLSDTIDNFRDFIKEDRTFSSVSMKKVLENTLSLVEASLKSNHIQLIKSLDDDITIDGNLNELTEAFINIINNSKDALKEKVKKEDERYLFISTNKIDDDTIEINIKDNGGGIKEDIIHRIFEPYFTTKHQSVGTGLGLAMVDKIVRVQYKASIKVENITINKNDISYQGTCMSIKFNKKKKA